MGGVDAADARDRASVLIAFLLLSKHGRADGERRYDGIARIRSCVSSTETGFVSLGDISIEILSTASGVVVFSFRLRVSL